MKYICYSIFGDPYSFEFNWYLRGLVFNLRMNKLLYPDWHTQFSIERSIWFKYEPLFSDLNTLIQYGFLPESLMTAPFLMGIESF